MGGALRIGMIGLGTISGQYFDTIPGLESLQLVAVADLDPRRAEHAGREHGVRALGVDELMQDDAVDAVLNLTIPSAHVEVGLRALAAGKHLYGEKPLGLSTAEARGLLDSAGALRVGSAPDTVLGTGIQTARQALDDGAIGEAIGASVHWSSPGHELWHPAPGFYYQPGGGPLFDMGPYYLTSLVSLFGPVARVTGSARRSSRERIVATGASAGSDLPVDVDTHVTAILEHVGGVTSSVTVSFEVWATRSPQFEVYGTAGTMAVPDPNRFSDPVGIWTTDQQQWRDLPDLAGYRNGGRGIGLADMAVAIASGSAHRASGELAFHVLEIMESVLVASRDHRVVELASSVERPAVVPLGSQL